jgi:SAM-dependent methyltransferase
MKGYWDSLASQFQHQQPPLRPCAEDAGVIQRIIQEQNRQYSQTNTNVLLFGVTPEIVNLAWPTNTFLVAVEKSQPMIDLVWPGNILHQRQVIRGNWLDAKLKRHSFDFIVGDGFLTALSYPKEYAQIADRIFQWLKPDGLLIARLFIRVSKKETFAKILADLKANRIARFDILKWRLAMAIQRTTQEGVIVDDIYRTWNKIEKELPHLSEQTGWPRLTVDTIKLYAGRMNRYAFPTIEELKNIFSAHLKLVSITIPTYDFGQHCPILAYRNCPAKKGC